jgi:hypothetical protein
MALWDVCRADQRELCVTLQMATRRLAAERLTLGQVAALRDCLELLRDSAPNTHERSQIVSSAALVAQTVSLSALVGSTLKTLATFGAYQAP